MFASNRKHQGSFYASARDSVNTETFKTCHEETENLATFQTFRTFSCQAPPNPAKCIFAAAGEERTWAEQDV